MKEATASLHTPAELLDGAEALLRRGEPQFMRAAVLEAITALEAFVQRTVIGVLHEKLDTNLVTWLDEKTRMDFDTRLSLLAPIALGHPVDTSSERWQRYKSAKKIRNSVTHTGRRVTFSEAEEVVRTVHEWLSFLGSTVEVDLELLAFRRHFEKDVHAVDSGRRAEEVLRDYFGSSSAARATAEQGGADRRADLVLTFGRHTVVLEAKVINTREYEPSVDAAVQQVLGVLPSFPEARAAVVVFNLAGFSPELPHLRHADNGRVSILLVSSPLVIV